jgi:two-component system cell cycle response regulator
MPDVIDNRIADSREVGVRAPASLAAVSPSSGARCDTPSIPSQPHPAGVSRATLTLLTGTHAGRLVTIDAAEVIIGRAGSSDVVVEDPGVSERHARVARTSDGGGFYVEDLGSTNGTFVGSDRIGLSVLHGGEVVQLGPQLRMRFAMVDVLEESLHRRLYESSIHDPLTHVFNRSYFADRLVAEVARARRAQCALAVLMTDVDGMKRVNDTFGHFAGDRTLCIVGARMKRALRGEDILARYGGDEFVIVAPETGRVEAARLAERVRRAIEELQMSAQGQHVGITLSVGVASLAEVNSADDPIAALFALADARLYGAKAAGRNRVCSVISENGAPPVDSQTNRN